MSDKYALLGGGGLAIELIDYMSDDGLDVAGYYAPEEDETCSRWIRYLGDERESFSRNYKYIVASGYIDIRKRMISFLDANDLPAASYISKMSHVSKISKIGRGAIISPFSSVNGDAVAGDFLMMGAHSNIDHHNVLGDNIVLYTGALINGRCTIGSHTSVGSNAAVIPNVHICSEVIIGAGATVLRDITEPGTYVGTPARKVR